MIQCVCLLMPSCNTYHLTLVSLTLDKGYLLTAALPDLQCGIDSLGPPVPAQPPLLGRGVGPPAAAPDLGRVVALIASYFSLFVVLVNGIVS